jgi:hypothetical protein
MIYAIEIGSGGMIYVPISRTVGSGIKVTLQLLPQQYGRL